MQEYGDVIMDQMKGSDIVLKSDDIELGPLLGHGTFGAVYAGTLGVATPVALKEAFAFGVNQTHAAQCAIKEAIHEATVLYKLKHPNIVQVYLYPPSVSLILIHTLTPTSHSDSHSGFHPQI